MGSRFSRLKRGVEAASAFEEADKKTGNDKDGVNNNAETMKEDPGKEVPAIDNIDPENKDPENKDPENKEPENKEPENTEPVIENDIGEKSINKPATVNDRSVENNKPIVEKAFEEPDVSLESKTDTKKESTERKNVPENNQSLLEIDNKENSTNEPSLIKEDLLAISGKPDLIGNEKVFLEKRKSLQKRLVIILEKTSCPPFLICQSRTCLKELFQT